MEYALSRATNADIETLSEISALLSTHHLEITENMRHSIIGIGENFEFYRPVYNLDNLPTTVAALLKLYELFGVKPVERREIFDSSTPIKVTSAT